MAIPASSAVQRREWITPQGQLDRLLKHNSQSIAYPISTSAISSPGLGQIEELPHIAGIISEYAMEALGPELTDWHTALKRRGALPGRIPALPRNMPQILGSKCPIYGDQKKPDGTHYRYRDTWSLSLKTPETVNELEANVRAYGAQALNAQGERLYPNANPLQFIY